MGDGFHTRTLPTSAGAPTRLPEMAVKLRGGRFRQLLVLVMQAFERRRGETHLNGVTAKTKPSSGRYSTRFQVPVEFSVGCCV